LVEVALGAVRAPGEVKERFGFAHVTSGLEEVVVVGPFLVP
jgi:hypothetical protein